MIKSKIVFALLLMVLSSCGLNIEKEIEHPYYIVSVESDWDTNISVKLPEGNYEGIIPNKVIEYALVKEYILAKQQDYDYRTFKLEAQINYYVLKAGSWHAKKMTRKKFNEFLLSKNITNVKWRKT